jgi:hypothetical protein
VDTIKRGKRLFESVTSDEKPTPTAITKKGRDVQLMKIRNTCICYRYYYYSKIKRLRYEDVMTLLSAEFFYSPRTIINMLTAEESQLRQVFKEKKDVKELQRMYSFLSWNKEQ